jgi:crossover junction endodeoxyribonuclease RusA
MTRVTPFTDQAASAGPSPGILIRVHAVPAPQGSKKAIIVRGKAVVIEENKGPVTAWRNAVKAAALLELGTARGLLSTPLGVNVAFWLSRPQDHYGTGRNSAILKAAAPAWPAKRPDIDKLVRSTFDALTGTAWIDDSQVVEVSATKHYAISGPGASIAIRILGEGGHIASYPPPSPWGQGDLDPDYVPPF